MAITKQEKETILNMYKEWIRTSQSFFLVEYTGVTMKDLDAIRGKLRETGGEFHVVKNTLAKLAFEASGLNVEPGFLENSTAIGFAFKDTPATAKALSDFAKSLPAIKVKGGFMDQKMLTASQVSSLAELPSLPVLRARMLGMFSAPASKLVRTLAEPGRQVASVIKSFSEKTAASAA